MAPDPGIYDLPSSSRLGNDSPASMATLAGCIWRDSCSNTVNLDVPEPWHEHHGHSGHPERSCFSYAWPIPLDQAPFVYLWRPPVSEPEPGDSNLVDPFVGNPNDGDSRPTHINRRKYSPGTVWGRIHPIFRAHRTVFPALWVNGNLYLD